MREKPIKNVDNFKIIGITPACAGKTKKLEEAETDEEGSPPRVREKPLSALLLEGCQGITPACAGKTIKTNHQYGYE